MRFAVVALTCAGCGENYYAYDQDWHELPVPAGGVARVSIEVLTHPEAWPAALSDDAVRMGYYPRPRARSALGVVRIDTVDPRDVTHFPGELNVLDVWDGCDPTRDCDVVVDLLVTCNAAVDCDGGLSAEAFLSNQHPSDAPPDAMTLAIQTP